MGRALIVILIVLAVLFIFGGAAGYLFLYTDVGSQVAVIPIRGTISVFGEASSQKIAKQIREADQDFAVKAIILEINSPGGGVVGSEEIARAVDECNKPVVAWIREVGASGAYWVASSADYIVAEPAAITGSIGVSASYVQYAGLMDKYGITYERIVSGKYKEVGSPYTGLDSEGRAMLQEKVNIINDMFIQKVADSRGMSYSEVKTLATGEVFLGTEAHELGLVDETGGKDVAFRKAKELAGVTDADISEASYNGLLEDFFSSSAYWFGRGFADAILKITETARLEA